MSSQPRNFVDVDDLSRRISVSAVLAHFGLVHEIAQQTGHEIRSRCFLNCGKTEPTGERVLAIQDEDVKRWCCHKYDCPHKSGGNLVGLVDLLLPGENAAGRPRGERFKEVLRTLQTIAGGAPAATPRVEVKPKPVEPAVNVPLAEHPNERARVVVNLYEKLIHDPAAMNPAAASYFRRRPYLTPELCTNWQVGYLPHDSGGDKSGGTMRGKIVYPIHDVEGRALTWFGRDPQYEEKHAAWQRGDRSDREPAKVHFVKGFQRGLEWFGQHRLSDPKTRAAIQALGTLILCEGPNDVLRLDELGVPALAACSNRVTREQVFKIDTWCRELQVAAGLLFDLDPEGEAGQKQALAELAEQVPTRLLWSRSAFDGRYQARQPESLTIEEWHELATRIAL